MVLTLERLGLVGVVNGLVEIKPFVVIGFAVGDILLQPRVTYVTSDLRLLRLSHITLASNPILVPQS